ncbi:MAG: DUF2891 domain-containing protein [Ferruginibacter sp.]|nr:DUF2891 domain-containing protein [Ferruginibacter sp.]
MKQLILLGIFLLIGKCHFAQETPLIAFDSTHHNYVLTTAGASHLAKLPLHCIHKEFPNKTSHTSNSAEDHVQLPSSLHPSFYGCFDWHSSVHGHWMLIRLLKLYPEITENKKIREVLNTSFQPEKIIAEAMYFNQPNTKSWERTYGWAWLLKLDEELTGWNDPDALQWHKALQPLTQKIVTLWMDFLPKQTYPNRTGVHPNTAFGLVFAIDYARKTGNKIFEQAIVQAAQQLYGKDQNAPAIWEPNGSDFLSPSLEEADLMKRVLQPEAFTIWRDAFFDDKSLIHLTVLPVVSDRDDLQIVHLDGLCFSRSWCMQGLANTYPDNHPNRKRLLESANKHLVTALPEIASGKYSGEHWLASFAVYALTLYR